MDIEIKVRVGERDVNSRGVETWADMIYDRSYVISGTHPGLTEYAIKEAELYMRVIIRDLERQATITPTIPAD